MTTRLPVQLVRLMARAQRRPPPCLLCGGTRRRVAVAAFVPTEPQRWGFPPGWAGGCVYGLCRKCHRLEDWQGQVEAVLWDTRARRAAPWN